MKLWLVGQTLNDDGTVWEFQGVFSTEELALSACVKDNFFIARITVDYALTVETCDWELCWYPAHEPRPME